MSPVVKELQFFMFAVPWGSFFKFYLNVFGKLKLSSRTSVSCRSDLLSFGNFVRFRLAVESGRVLQRAWGLHVSSGQWGTNWISKAPAGFVRDAENKIHIQGSMHS